jgi:hypothetical protein
LFDVTSSGETQLMTPTATGTTSSSRQPTDPDRPRRWSCIAAAASDAAHVTAGKGSGVRVVDAIAAEHRAGYDAEASTDAPAGDPSVAGPAEPDAPFGVRVLAELPAFASALDAFVSADARMLEGIVTLARLVDTDQVEHTTGLSIEQWLGILARQTRMDRRLLLRLCRLLHRYPTLADGVEAGRVSFAQLRGVGIALRDAPASIDERLDELLGRLLSELSGADPDTLVNQIREAILELTPRKVYDRDPRNNRLWIQPNLDRTGGRYGGELDTIGLSILDDATAPTRTQLRHPGGTEAARADNLLAHLVHTCSHDDEGPGERNSGDEGPAERNGGDEGPGERNGGDEGPGERDGGDEGPGERNGGDAGAADHDATSSGRDGMDGWMARLASPKLLLRAELSALLDGERLPATVLTHLVGGQLKLSSEAARRLLEARGAQLRTVIVDQGRVVGVGRASRQPPGWLSDIALAVHDTCTGPLCDRPALGADLDHASPWWPVHPDDPYGTTDADNLAPLCLTTNRTRHLTGWRVVQHPDGRRTWTHRATGLSVTSVPSTWRPPGWQRPHHGGVPERPPGGSDPPCEAGAPDGTGPPVPSRPDGIGSSVPPALPPDDLPF